MISRRSGEMGFTLVEVTIAVAILSVSLVTLLGLETSIMQQAVRDRDRQNTLLVVRRVLAAVEASEDPLEAGTRTGPVRALLQQFMGTEDERNLGRDPGLDMESRLQVDYFKIPGIENDRALKKAVLTVFWGPSELDSLDVVFFVPDTEVEIEEDQDPDSGNSSGGSG